MEKDVTRQIEEQLSAFLDGELPEQELALLVRRLERDQSHRATLDRYALISCAMRDEGAEAVSLRRDVMAVLDGEAAAVATLPPARRLPRPALALAAGVAAVAVVLGFNLTQVEGPVSPAEVAATREAPATAPVAVASAVATPAARPAAVVAEAAGSAERVTAPATLRQSRPPSAQLHQQRLRSYLISHGEYARPLQGAMADSRMYVQQASFQE